jgi:hypothetical protein
VPCASPCSPCPPWRRRRSSTTQASNAGAIPDNNPDGRAITFNVSGFVGPVAALGLDIDLTHTWVGDLEATLISPGGVARMVVFGRVGSGRTNGTGDNSNLAGLYQFRDTGASLWSAALAAATSNDVIPPGFYHPASRGAPNLANAGGCPTSFRGVFGGLGGSQVNGTWTLLVADRSASDLGAVNSALLILDNGPPQIFGDGFEPGIALAKSRPKGLADPRCYNKPFGDLNGDGLTDYTLVRNVGGNAEWRVRTNTGGGSAAAETSFVHGGAFDFFDMIDLDGDRVADPTVWTEATGQYRVRLSSRNGAVRTVTLGATGDRPAMTGDYDGDAIDDLAVLRRPAFGQSPGPMSLIVRLSGSGETVSVPMGTGREDTHFASGGLDFNGDALADVAIQGPTQQPGIAEFQIRDGRSGVLIEDFVFGVTSDFVIPGSHAGDSRADITLGRLTSGQRVWETRDSQTGNVLPLVQFGIVGDVRISGDYDGDGISDYAGWRPSSTPGESRFVIRSSVAPATTFDLPFGQNNDFPAAAARVN